MPCSDERSSPSYWQSILDERTDMLCRILKHVEVSKPELITKYPDIEKWWKFHKEFDKSQGR